MGLWLAGGGIWPCVKVGFGLGGFMAGWGWYLAVCALQNPGKIRGPMGYPWQ
jgi:hypothetical protein